MTTTTYQLMLETLKMILEQEGRLSGEDWMEVISVIEEAEKATAQHSPSP